MPTVPAYDDFQVAARPAAGVRQSSVASPSVFTSALAPPLPSAGTGLEAVGRGLMAVGGDAARIAVNMQDRENADMLARAEAAFANDLGQYRTAVSQRLGADAKGVTADTEKWFGETTTKLSQGLTTDAQRRLFTERAQKLRAETMHSVSMHEAVQARHALEDSGNAAIVGAINLAAANANDWTVAEARKKDIRAWVDVIAQVNGKGPEWRAQKTGENITRLHEQVLQQLVATNKVAAKAYFDKYEQEIDGSKRAELGEFATKATAAAVGAAAAQAVWRADGPKSDNDASHIDKMKDRLREELKDNPFARDAALHELSQIDADRDKAIRARDAKRLADVNAMFLKGDTIAKVQQSAAWAELDGSEQLKLLRFEEDRAQRKREHAASMANIAENRAFTAERRAQARLNTAGLDTMLMLQSHPEVLVAMGDADLINLRTQIGDENVLKLVSKKQEFTKSREALSEAKIDNDQFKTFAIRAGLDPTVPATQNKEKAQRVIELRDKIERVIDSEQQAKKRKLTREEKDTLLQREIDNSVILSNPIWFDDKAGVPAITLTPEQQRDAYVNVNGKDVRLSSIPAADRIAIINARRAAGLPITEKSIAEMWLRKNARQTSSGPIR